MSARHDNSIVNLSTLPTTELVPSLLSGVLPHQHRVWQVSLRQQFRQPSKSRLIDTIPDVVTSTIQCGRHYIDRTYDLSALPYRRRQRFNLHRFKYTRREENPAALTQFGGYQSIFGVLGREARYVFTKNFAELDELSRELPKSPHLLTFLEMYAFDLTQHWHLDNHAVMTKSLIQTDEFFGRLRQGCRDSGVRLMLLVDHGQEPVTGTIPLMQALQSAGVSRREYTFFVELSRARIWFHTTRAREAILPKIEALQDSSIFDWKQMHEFGVCFGDDQFGEYYVFADAGNVFFPHDFFNPIGNAFLGITDKHQRQRFHDPVHRGNHGYLPHFPSEQGWMIPVDQQLTPTTNTGHIVDVAPTLLSLLGKEIPEHMRGSRLFAL